MPEIKTKPTTVMLEGGDMTYTFTEDHTIADVIRWLLELCDAEDIDYVLWDVVSKQGGGEG